MKLTAELLEKLVAWQKSGDRGFKILTYRHYDDVSVCVNDYSDLYDIEITESNVNENWAEMLFQNKKAFLLSELDRCTEIEAS